MAEDEMQSIPWKAKVSYELIFLQAIMDCRKMRMEQPGISFVNSVLALKMILHPAEMRKIEKYELDPDMHFDELLDIEKKLQGISDENLRNKIRLNYLKHISFPLFCREVDRLYRENKLEDRDFDGNVNHMDATIIKYEAFLERIIEVLKEGGWIVKAKTYPIHS
jgi:hypothetical protein